MVLVGGAGWERVSEVTASVRAAPWSFTSGFSVDGFGGAEAGGSS